MIQTRKINQFWKCLLSICLFVTQARRRDFAAGGANNHHIF